MTDSEQDKTHDLRSFGRRRGRKPSERQVALMHEVLPRVAVDRSAPSNSQGTGEKWIEIGFGGGEHLMLGFDDGRTFLNDIFGVGDPDRYSDFFLFQRIEPDRRDDLFSARRILGLKSYQA